MRARNRVSAADTGAETDADRDAQPADAGTDVTIEGLTVAFDQPAGGVLEAVSDATLHIEAGSMVALLGPSGCGKTSLLRAVAGLERPSSGRITIGGTVVSDTAVSDTVGSSAARGAGIWVRPERRHVGMVFQDGALFPHLTVAENIAFGLGADTRSKRGPTRSDRVAEMLALVDLVDFADRLPGTLSGGQQQRVALARSLAPQPRVLLLDEPFSALDAALRVQVRSEVARIVRAVGVTTIFVTHDQDEAFVLGDRVAVLRNGRVEQVGTPDAIYRHPETPWIAGFVGEANFVAGVVDVTTPTHDSPTYANQTHDNPTHAVTALGPVPIQTARRWGDGTGATVPVRVLVRPEQVVIEPDQSDGGARVTAVEYYGHDARYELALDDGTSIAARTQSPDLVEVGRRVGVRFQGRATEAWPTEPA
jgi:iron(III) transport system ATP-binding protein